jgi:hypothetical protein
MSYTNLNNPANYQLQSFGQNGVRTISTDQLYIQGEYYRVLVAEEDSYVTAVSVLGDDLTAEFVYAGTTIYGLFTEVSVTSGSLTAYIAGPTDIEDVWAYINAYGEANAATIEAADCAKDAIAPLLDKYYAKASLVMVPSLYKTSIVYSERPLTTDGQLAFTRSNDTATRVGPDGLIEKVRTNLLLQSNTFNTTWTAVSSTLTSGQSGYDGSTDAWLLEKSNSGGRIYQANTFNSFGVFSIYAKAGTKNWIRLRDEDNAGAYFDLSGNGAVGTTNLVIDAKIQSVGNGWFRCSIIANFNATDFLIYVADGNGDVGGTSGNIYIQDAQLETGDIATDYIPTTTVAVSVGPVANLPRLNYPINSDGSVGCPSLLLEPQRVNLQTFSESFDNAVYVKTDSSITSNAIISPDGYTNADKLNTNTTNNHHRIVGNAQATAIAAHTMSIFAKKGEYKYIGIAENNNDVGYGVFDLNAGTVLTSGSGATNVTMQSMGNGWYRCQLTFTAGAFSRFDIYAINDSYTTGNPSAYSFIGAVGDGLYIYGAALEQGAYATSYIPTLGAAVTRGGDSCSKTGISSLIGQTEGTLFVEVAALSGANDVRQISVNDGTTSNRVTMALLSSGTQIQFVVQSGGSVVMDSTQTIAGLTSGVKIAYAYKVNDFAVYVNGSLLATDTNGAVPISMSAFSFDAGNSGDKFFGKIAQALLFKTRLTNQELQDLTTL